MFTKDLAFLFLANVDVFVILLLCFHICCGIFGFALVSLNCCHAFELMCFWICCSVFGFVVF